MRQSEETASRLVEEAGVAGWPVLVAMAGVARWQAMAWRWAEMVVTPEHHRGQRLVHLLPWSA